ncbi:MAG: DUF4380 domain-containing protein [Bacteroidota bacterium]
MMRAYCILLLVVSFFACERGSDVPPSGTPQATTLAIASGKHRVGFDLASGGRLASYTLEGQELLQTKRDANGWQWGSTVWTSPQAAWNWPPEATFDALPFAVVERSDNAIVLQSDTMSSSGLQLTKSFRFVSGGKGQYLEAEYRLYNHGQDTVYRGVWENTRLPYTGEYSVAVDSLRRDLIERPFRKRTQYTVMEMTQDDHEKGKLFVHPGKGRATYTGNGLSFRKLWVNDPEEPVAPGQAPLEIYFAPEEGFTEFEIQGPYRAIAPGEYVNLVVAWKVSRLVAE